MSYIDVVNLTFGYEESPDLIFDGVSFLMDTDWKLGCIGRNGKGKTTFLNLLRGKYPYQGTIHKAVRVDYFPYETRHEEECASEFLTELKSGCEEWRVICELDRLEASAELLYRPFASLSHGECTKVLLAVLFSGENDFLLIDEPTNHLDREAREVVKRYLQGKKGFLLVSHDRDLLDDCVDHVMVLNRTSIEIQKGNFSSWWENKRCKDSFAKTENEKHLREIASLKKAADQSSRWAIQNESSKIGFDPCKEHDRFLGTRSYIGAKTKKMQARVRQYERRMEREIAEKEGLLQDIENPVELKLNPMQYHKERLLVARNLTLGYRGSTTEVLQDFSLELKWGQRIFLHGKNGCGKSTFLKAVITQQEAAENQEITVRGGSLQLGSGLVISYVCQDTSFLKGRLEHFCERRGLEKSLFFALLRQLDLERIQFSKNLEDYSEGQKKKVLLAASLITPAHVYIWDEPLNYMDVFSRMQIEELILKFQPTMILVEHDVRFRDRIATDIIEL